MDFEEFIDKFNQIKSKFNIDEVKLPNTYHALLFKWEINYYDL